MKWHEKVDVDAICTYYYNSTYVIFPICTHVNVECGDTPKNAIEYALLLKRTVWESM